jgi:N-acetyl-anhydromuramyl-L-alanine amidase AmpD
VATDNRPLWACLQLVPSEQEAVEARRSDWRGDLVLAYEESLGVRLARVFLVGGFGI